MAENILNNFRQHPNCITFLPALKKKLSATDELLSHLELARIPHEYTAFLQLTDGMIFNGIEFFGTTKHPRRGYIFPDLKTINLAYARYSFFKNKIILGHASETLLIYDDGTKKYSIADRINLRPLNEVNSFKKLLLSAIDFLNFTPE